MEDRRLEKNCDIVVVGAGHAGCEAALACARLGLNTVMFTVSVDSIALMPCNPNIGGRKNETDQFSRRKSSSTGGNEGWYRGSEIQ